MRLLLLFLLLAFPALAAVTTVAQSVHAPDGTLADGKALIRISKSCQSGVNYVGDKTIRVDFLAGAFTVNLVPNDTCSPSGYTGSTCPDCRTSYTVAWLLNDGTAHTETWVVPTSLTPVTVSSVIVSTVPISGVPQINPGQIAQDGAVTGNGLCWNGTSYAPGTCQGAPGPPGSQGVQGIQGIQGVSGAGTVGSYYSGVIAGPSSGATIAGSTHLLTGTNCNVMVSFRDSSNAAFLAGYAVAPTTCDVTYAFGSPQSNFRVYMLGTPTSAFSLLTISNAQLLGITNAQLLAMTN